MRHAPVASSPVARLNYADWVPGFVIPKPGVRYEDTYTWEFKGHIQPAAQQKLRELLGGG